MGLEDARPPRIRPDARASKRRPARSARASRTPSAWPSPSAGSPPSSTATATRSSTTGRTCIASDGDLQEGIASEAASPRRPPAARQARRPVRRQPHPARWPDVDGLVGGRRRSASRPTAGTPSASRTATTSTAIEAAITAARADDRPSLIAVRTHIGFGSPNKQDSQKAHGAPLGPDEVRLTKEAYGWDPDRTFYVPADALARLPRRRCRPARTLVDDWDERARRATRDGHVGRWPRSSCGGSRASCRRLGRGPQDLRGRRGGRDAQRLAGRDPGAGRTRCRSCSAAPPTCPNRNLTDVKGEPNFSADEAGRNLRFGVREHGMGGDRQRHRLPRRVHPVRRDVPDLQRLHARLRPARGARRAARDLRLDARLGRASARTARPTSRSSTTRRCGRSRTCGSSGRATRTRRRRPGRSPIERRDGPVGAGADPAEAARRSRARPRRRARASRRGGYVLREATRRRARQLILIATGSELQLAMRAAEALEDDGHRDARRVAPLLGAVRGTGPGLSRRRSCRRRSGSA